MTSTKIFVSFGVINLFFIPKTHYSMNKPRYMSLEIFTGDLIHGVAWCLDAVTVNGAAVKPYRRC